MATDSNKRLTEINAELSSLLEARVQELMGVMRTAEQTTRQIVSTEMELSRYRQLQDSMSGEMGDLKRELSAVKARADEVRSQHSSLSGERDRLKTEVARLERETQEFHSEVDRYRNRSSLLHEEQDGLHREIADLRAKVRNLEDKVNQLRKLKEELMASFSGLNHQIAALNPSPKE